MVVNLRTEIIRESRKSNSELIDFLCQAPIIMDLVRTTFDLAPFVGPVTDISGSQRSAISTDTPPHSYQVDAEKERYAKLANVASDLLACDNNRITEAILTDPDVMDKIFSYLEQAEPGDLNTYVAHYFAKVMINLFKMQNTFTVAQIAKRGVIFISVLLKHIDNIDIANLLVRILDGPDADPHTYTNANRRPTQAVIEMLVNVNVFNRLAECFVKASTDPVEAQLNEDFASGSASLLNDSSTAPDGVNTSDANSQDSPNSDALLGKHSSDAKLSERPCQKLRSQDYKLDSQPSENASTEHSSKEVTTDSDSKNTPGDTPPKPAAQAPTACTQPDNLAEASLEIGESSSMRANPSPSAVTSAEDSGEKLPQTSRSILAISATSSLPESSASTSATTAKADLSSTEAGEPSLDTRIPSPIDISKLDDDDMMSLLPRPPLSGVKSGMSPSSTTRREFLGQSPPEDSLEVKVAKRRRLREETMSNVLSTIFGLTERMLQLPELGGDIPAALCVYETPPLISGLLDAGIYVSCVGWPEGGVGLKTDDKSNIDAERVEVVSSGSNSALMHALGLAAELLTTDLNIFRDSGDEHDGGGDRNVHQGINGGGAGGANLNSALGVGVRAYSGKGISASVGATLGPSTTGSASTSTAGAPVEPKTEDATAHSEFVVARVSARKVGDKLISTSKLEDELSVRFGRLAMMLGDVDGKISGSADSEEGFTTRPLGSLRLKLVEFFVACMKQGSMQTVEKIMELGVPQTLLKLFDKHRWSSMLHLAVANSIKNCFSSGDSGRPGRTAWFGAGLVTWLIAVWDSNAEDESTPRWGRSGYMGHLIKIGLVLESYLRLCDHDGELPSKEELQQFELFAEKVLRPAQETEARPLVDMNPSSGHEVEEGEEATDVLDMGGMQFVESVSGNDTAIQLVSYNAMKASAEIDDEGEIKPVETSFEDEIKRVVVEDDLSHFGGDDDVVESVTSVDHDIPADIRERLAACEDSVDPASSRTKQGSRDSAGGGSKADSKGSGSSKPKKLTSERSAADVSWSGARSASDSSSGSGYARGELREKAERRSETREVTAGGDKTGLAKGKGRGGEYGRNEGEVGRASGGQRATASRVEMETGESSSEDEAKYVAFVDEGKGIGYDADGLVTQMERMKVNDQQAPSASLDGVVTEIDDDPGLSSELNVNLASLSGNVMDNNSSDDEEYDAWQETASSEVPARSGADT